MTKWTLILAVSVVAVVPLKAEEMKVLASPNAQAIPLFVLAAKQHEWLPDATLEIIEASQPEDSASVAASVKTKHVQYGLFNVLEGARAYEQGADDLRLAASFLWGSPVILTRNEIRPGDWAALGGSTGVTSAPVHMPLYTFGKEALRKEGLSSGEINLRSMSHSEIVNMMKYKVIAPTFAIVPEPEVTEILTQQQKEHWNLQYYRFADVITILNPNGLPLGGLWIINQPAHASEFLMAFENAVEYINDPQNITSVSVMVAEGFRKYFTAFPDLGSTEVTDMLKRGNLILRYNETSSIKEDLAKLWQQFGVSPDQNIFYVAQE